MLFSGAMTALVTPFKNNALDEEAYRNFIEFQITEGIHGLVPCGTTGESATLSHEEHERVIEICIDQAKGRVPVLAGAGSNNTIEAIRLTRFAKKAGADGALLITPYYNKPTQEGLFQHFSAVAGAIGLPAALFIAAIKGLFAFLTRGVSAGLMSLCGGLLSTLIMGILWKKTKFTPVFIGVCGAFGHNLAQLLVALWLTGFGALGYIPALALYSVVCGI